MIPHASEHQIQNAILGYLRYRGYKCFRMNSGGMRSVDSRGKEFLVRLHEAGTPDIMAFKTLRNNQGGVIGTQTLFVEVKAGKNKPTFLQLNKMQELEEYGAQCIVAYSVEDLESMGI